MISIVNFWEVTPQWLVATVTLLGFVWAFFRFRAEFHEEREHRQKERDEARRLQVNAPLAERRAAAIERLREAVFTTSSAFGTFTWQVVFKRRLLLMAESGQAQAQDLAVKVSKDTRKELVELCASMGPRFEELGQSFRYARALLKRDNSNAEHTVQEMLDRLSKYMMLALDIMWLC